MIEAVLLSKFNQLIRQDPHLQGTLQCSIYGCLTIAEGYCVFTLEQLFEWVKAEVAMDYPEFRCAVYKSTLNQKLAILGYKIEVRQSKGHIDTNTYQLIRLLSM
ncbi:hypothetical protein [Marinagarivorans algicola]|uniref:hypothetical protein n=1 Tax=Marinagarivorans algicola TaxID=1513270 RepID=UPI0006B48959|nr:hypothetical protein [Marinagarivorans algicola]